MPDEKETPEAEAKMPELRAEDAPDLSADFNHQEMTEAEQLTAAGFRKVRGAWRR